MEDYLVKWDSSLETGIKKIDNEHTLIIEYTNQLYKFIITGRKTNEFVLIFENIYHLFLEHLKNEEEFMQIIEYPLFPEHRRKHEEFLISLSEMKNKLQKGEENAQMYVFNLLSEWLINHLLSEDKKIAKFYFLNSKVE